MMDQIFTLLLLLHSAVAFEPATLTQAPQFAMQRPCARDCFTFGYYVGPDKLASVIGCDFRNPDNACVCRLDLQPDANAYLRSCVDRECRSNTLDTNSATSLYDEYCTGAGFIRQNTATTTAGTDDDPSSPTVTVTVTATITVSSAQRRVRSPLHGLVANLARFR